MAYSLGHATEPEEGSGLFQPPHPLSYSTSRNICFLQCLCFALQGLIRGPIIKQIKGLAAESSFQQGLGSVMVL